MANDYLISKWKQWHKALDVNHDGKMSMDDVKDCRANFVKLVSMDAEQSKLAEENMTRWWVDFIFRGRTGEITEEQFIDRLSSEFSADSEKFKGSMEKCFTLIFDMYDTNKDRGISEEEWVILFQTYGHSKAALVTKAFAGFKHVNGLVPLATMVEAWVTYTTCLDPNVPDVVKQAFDIGA